MFNLPGGAEFYIATSPGIIEHRNDGTWVLTQSVMATDGSGGGWDIEATYGSAMDWDAWSNQDIPTSFKRDCADIIDDHENWAYRILESGSLVGTGSYQGSVFYLTHAPANQYYAFQNGYGANNMNDAYGYSGWFNYSGNFNNLTAKDPATSSVKWTAACLGPSNGTTRLWMTAATPMSLPTQ